MPRASATVAPAHITGVAADERTRRFSRLDGQLLELTGRIQRAIAAGDAPEMFAPWEIEFLNLLDEYEALYDELVGTDAP